MESGFVGSNCHKLTGLVSASGGSCVRAHGRGATGWELAAIAQVVELNAAVAGASESVGPAVHAARLDALVES